MTNNDYDSIHFSVDASEDRYARQRLIPWWDQERLLKSKILVIGAGALGNEVLKNLALLGVGHVLVVDFDLIELSNLSRTVLFTPSDLGKPKAQVAAEAIQRMNPHVKAEWLCGDVEIDLGLNRIKQFDLALGCVDSVNARWALNRSCMRVGIPWINAGISATAGEVALFDPNEGGCYECGMTQGMWKRFNERYSCMLLLKSLPENKVPTTAVVSSMTAALQVNEAIGFLHSSADHLRGGQKLFCSLKPYNFFVVDIPRDAQCMSHESFVPCMAIKHSPDELTASQLLDLVPGSRAIELDWDIVVALSCPQCGDDRCCVPAKKFRLEDVNCPKCGQRRLPSTIHEIARTHDLATEQLSNIGVPKNAILRVKRTDEFVYVSLG